MKKIVHNKKQNSALLFELLAQQVVSSIVSKNDIKAKKALYLIRKYFKSGTQLYEELQLVNTIIYNEVSSWRTASRLLSEVILASNNLDLKKLANEKFHLISEINANFDKNIFYNQFVPTYRVYGAIYSLLEAHRMKVQVDVAQKVKLEEVVISHLMENPEVKRINEFAKAPEYGEVDDLAFAFILRKFNQKYKKVLTESQKEILREYIKCSSDRKYDQFVEKQTKKIENALYEAIKSVGDKGIVTKIYEAMMKLTGISEKQKDSKTEMLMTYSQLVDELKKLDEGE